MYGLGGIGQLRTKPRGRVLTMAGSRLHGLDCPILSFGVTLVVFLSRRLGRPRIQPTTRPCRWVWLRKKSVNYIINATLPRRWDRRYAAVQILPWLKFG